MPSSAAAATRTPEPLPALVGDPMTVHELAPERRSYDDIAEMLDDGFFTQKPLGAFDVLGVEFLAALSNQLLASPETRGFPEIVALAYWLRPANVRRFVWDVESTERNAARVPRGVALHIAPANVDTLFMYSFALSLLAGNLNVVRVSQRPTAPLARLLDELRLLLQQPAWQELACRNCVLTYAHNKEINRYLSERANVRVLWGGDSTVGAFRALPARVDVHDLVFPDRFSYCAIQAEAYLAAEADRRRALAEQFYNDAYWFDQKACSSPQVVYFVGPADRCRSAAPLFWDELSAVVLAKGRMASPAEEMNHLVFLYEQMAEGQLSFRGPNRPGGPKYVRLSDPTYRPEMCGGGMFIEAFVASLDELAELVRGNDQTLTCFGFSQDDIRQFVQATAGRGLSRVVPIGQALNFSPRWDGYDLLRELTRLVAVLVE